MVVLFDVTNCLPWLFVSEVITNKQSRFRSHDDHLFFDMNSDEVGDVKLPLPNFLKLFTDNNVPVPKAMAIAGKMFVVRVRNPVFCTYHDQLQGI